MTDDERRECIIREIYERNPDPPHLEDSVVPLLRLLDAARRRMAGLEAKLCVTKRALDGHVARVAVLEAALRKLEHKAIVLQGEEYHCVLCGNAWMRRNYPEHAPSCALAASEVKP